MNNRNFNGSTSNTQTSIVTCSKAIREASERRAKKLHFYQNGRPYDAKLTVSMIPGKEFVGLEQLYQFLTEKTQILNGVQYIFTTYGEVIRSIDQLEHDKTYVVSGTKSFVHYPYGLVKNGPVSHSNTNQTSPRPRHKFIREDDLRLIRPLSSKYNNVYANNVNTNSNLQLQTRDVRTITLVNNKNHNIHSKVILNLKSPKSFDLLLSDLGDAVQLKSPKIMFTSNGQRVKSVSHLKHELAHINLFYIDNEYPHEPLSLFDDPYWNQDFYYTSQSCINCNRCQEYPSNLNNSYSMSNVAINKVENNTIAQNVSVQQHSAKPESRMEKHRKALPLLQTKIDHKNDTPSSFIDKQKKSESELVATTFGIEQMSPYKYEQIQLYVEKLLNDTSFQIKSEFGFVSPKQVGLNPNFRKDDVPMSSSKKTPNPEITITSPSIKRKTPNVPTNRNRNLDLGKRSTLKNPAKNTNNLPIRQEKSKVPSISRSNDRINEISKPKNIRFLSNENLVRLSDSQTNINKSTTSLVSEKNNLPRKSSQYRKTGLENSTTLNKKPTRSTTLMNERSKSKNNLNEIRNQKTQSISSQKLPDNKDSPMARIKLRDIEKFLHGNQSPPSYYLSLDKVFGYNGRKSRDLVYLNTGELAFYSGVFAILWNPNTGKQRFYSEHENDICCLRVDPTCEYIATSHLARTTVIIRIWSIKTLKTIKILANKSVFVDMEFTTNNFLFILTFQSGKESNISLWNWKFKLNITNTSKQLDHNEQVFGLTVHPQESDIVVTYGKMHLVVWHFKKDKSIECRTALQMKSTIVKTIYCAEFLNDNSLLTGDSTGNLTIWAPFEVNKVLEFAIKEVKGHESQLTCFKLTKENILISGDKEGAIKTWDVNDNEFRLLNAVKLPSLSGSVSAITIPNKLNDNMNIFVGTSNSFILKGSALQPDDYQIVFEGHYMAIRTISVDFRNNFYTASLDRKICKWNEHGLIWKTDSNIQGMSSSIHPSGQVLAVGSANGIAIIIDANSGEALQYIQLTTVCIGCMSYSPNGNFLVAGCQDGSLHVIPVMDNGRSYDKVSILKGPLPILTLQWSMDTQFILTSVDDDNYQELILWDLPNSRYIRNVTNFSNNLQWYNVTCSGLEDARGTWDNENLKDVINMCKNYSPSLKCIVTGDEHGFIRLFSYPCFDTKASYFQYKQGGGSVTDVKFSSNEEFIVSCNFEGSIFLWKMIEYHKDTN